MIYAETIIVAMKLVDKNFANNARIWGVSGVWVDGEDTRRNAKGGNNGLRRKDDMPHPQGRFPANTIHDSSEAVLAEFAKAGASASRRSDYNTE